MKSKTKNIIICGLFISLMSVAAYIKIPTPFLPLSLQVLVCLTCSLVMGAKWGVISMATYLLLGLIGIPVFSLGGGLNYLLKPNFGYIIGFVLCAFICGFLANKKPNPSTKRMFVCAVIGLIALHLIGFNYFYFMSNFIGINVGYGETFFACTICLLPTDLAWCFVSSIIAKRISRVLK